MLPFYTLLNWHTGSGCCLVCKGVMAGITYRKLETLVKIVKYLMENKQKVGLLPKYLLFLQKIRTILGI